jgi:hypothetical protein
MVKETAMNEMRSCDWVKNKLGKELVPWRCENYAGVTDNCPRTCGKCIDLSNAPSMEPPSAAPTPYLCQDCTLTTVMVGSK